MTFWQENFGFVKEIYDYRILKYKEWMDNLEAIVSKVLAQDVNYTYKEFKIIQDTLAALCRDLEKEGVKQWLDVMHEKIAIRASGDFGSTAEKDKDLLLTEKKRVQGLIERHDGLMPRTKETQEKVETYGRCYSYRDDVSKIQRLLEEMHHLSTKNITHHSKKHVDEQIERAEKVITTLESVTEQYQDFIRRGQQILKVPHCAPFLAPLIEKLEKVWKEANKHSKERVEILNNYARCYSFGDDVGPLLKTLDEVLSSTSREAKSHTKKMVADQVEKFQKVVNTVESLGSQYTDSIRRGERLVKSAHCLPFLTPLVEKLQAVYETASKKPTERLGVLKSVVNAWEKFDEIRSRIMEPCNRLEEEYKTYVKVFDPKTGAEMLKKKRVVLEESKSKINDLGKAIQKSYTTIILLAGEDKRNYLDREIKEVEIKCNVVFKCEEKLKELEEYNSRLEKALKLADELKIWSKTTAHRLHELMKSTDSPAKEARITEGIRLQDECRRKLADCGQLDDEFLLLLGGEDGARKKMIEFEEIKKNLRHTYGEIEMESSNTSDYFRKVRELCEEFANMKSTTDGLIKAAKGVNPIYNPGISSMDIYFQMINDLYERKDKIVRAM